MTSAKTGLPAVTIARRGADRLRAGHVWVYRSDVVQADGILPGAVVRVQEQPGGGRRQSSDENLRATQPRTLGTALYSSASEIALRMISRGPVTDIHQLVRERIQAAIAYRHRFVQDTNAYRV